MSGIDLKKPQLLGSDLKAGLTVGVVLVPQAVAYAFLAGMPPIYGLYASLIPLIVYAIFGSSPHLAVGVNAVDMLIIAGGLAVLAPPGSDEYVGLVFLLALVTGVIQVAMGLLRLGFIVNLLSRPVATGFISGAGLMIGLNQMGALLGIQTPGSARVHVLALGLLEEAQNIDVLTAAVGVGSMILILLIKRSRPRFPAGLTAVILATLLTWYFDLTEVGVAVVGSLPRGLPWPSMPELSVQTLGDLLPIASVLALFQFMTVVSLSRTYAGKAGYRVHPNQELTALGASNIAGSMFQAIPISGSFSRTSILYTFGKTTKLANAMAAVVVAVTILFLTPFFLYVPEAVLAAIILVAVYNLIDWKEALYLLRIKRSDGLIAVLTFLTTILAGVVLGIAVGVAASVFAIMYRISRPYVAVLGHVPGTRSFRDVRRYKKATEEDDVLLLRLDASFSFANADFVRDKILRRVNKRSETRWLILDGSGINDLDMTASAVLLDITETLRERGVELYITGLKGRVRDTIVGTHLEQTIGGDHLMMTPYRAMRRIREREEASTSSQDHSEP
jgi:SulP family sulfate permease